MKQLFHTPEGLRDVYGMECEKKIFLQRSLQKVFHSYGYENIEPPSLEYFDVFGKQIGTTSSRELYKFFDRDGNTLALRPDFTPSIARAVSMYFHKEDMPIRLCYQGSTFVNHSSYRGRLRESTQMGVELIGDDSVDADGEVIALIVDLLKSAGLTRFQISIGQVDFFRALVRESGMEEETVDQLRQLINNKNYFGVEELLESQNLPKHLVELFAALPTLFGGLDVLEKAKKMTENPDALAAVSRLEELYQVLQLYGCEQYISFDLGMLSKFGYYTGIIFHGYTYGTGEALVKGGRYDHLLEQFGESAPAIGFGLIMERLVSALERQKISVPVKRQKSLLLYQEDQRKLAVSMAQFLRNNMNKVQCMKIGEKETMKDYLEYAEAHHFVDLIYVESEDEIITHPINDKYGSETHMPYVLWKGVQHYCNT